tara:strand:- start:223 stop:579 length:357 start_codon:yes stop_codon:yes gene_type:complete
MNNLDKLIEMSKEFNNELEEQARDKRMNIIAQNGNEGYHYLLNGELDAKQETNKTPKHYNNDKGSLYKVAEERGWNPYLFDIVKRLERSEKKGEFKSDLEKSKFVIDLWLNESNSISI